MVNAEPIGDFRGSRQRVVFGPAAVGRLPAILDSLGITKPMVVTGPTVAASAPFERVLGELDDRPSVVYPGSRPHAPRSAIEAGVAMLRSTGADGVVSLGGSSPVEVARGIAYFDALGSQIGPSGRPETVPHTSTVPIVAVTTTLSQAEFSNVLGLTDDATGHKTLHFDHGVMPECVILDPELAVHTPDRLWSGTGVKALDTAVDCFVQFLEPQPFWDGLLLSAFAGLYANLTAVDEPGDRARQRGHLQLAAWQAIYPRFHLPMLPSVAPATRWLGGAARHQLGGIYRCPHGELAGVLLAACLRFHREETGRRQELLAEAIGAASLDAMDEAITALVVSCGLPSTLSELGIGSENFDRIARAITAEEPSLEGREREVRQVLADVL